MTCKNAAIRVQIQRPNDHRIKKVFLLPALLLSCLGAFGQDHKSAWVDSVFKTMSVAQKIGQIFMIPSSSRLSKNDFEDLTDKIKDFHIGGIYVTGGGPVGEARLYNKLQAITKVPLLFGLSAGSGLGETLDSAMRFPSPLSMGALRFYPTFQEYLTNSVKAISREKLVYNMAETVARQMKMVGVQVNFGPNVSALEKSWSDTTCYSSNPINATLKAIGFVKGLHANGVLAVAMLSRNFGRSLDGKDSTLDYSSISPLNEHGSYDLFGLRSLIEGPAKVSGVMTNQLRFQYQENKKPSIAALSPAFMKDILRSEMNFQGVTFCWMPELNKIPVKKKKKKKKGQTEMEAVMAGNNMLIAPENLNAAFKLIQKSLKKSPLLMTAIDSSVKKILSAKYEAGLHHVKALSTDNLVLRLHSPEDNLFRHELAESIVTVARDSFSVIPIRTLEDKLFTSVTIGAPGQNEFSHYLRKYTDVENFSVNSLKDTSGLTLKLKSSEVVIVGIFPKTEGLQMQLLPFLRRMASKQKMIVCLFTTPSRLKTFAGFTTLLAGYSDDALIQKVAAEVIFGGLGAKGILPVDVTSVLTEGKGAMTDTTNRLTYTLPEAAGMDGKTLEQIRSIAMEAIDIKATPGCHVLVARNGKVICEQSFGYFTYDKKTPVTDETIYDLASVTKVSATLQTVMFMYEKGLIDLDKKVSVYLPELRKSNKKDFTIKDILTHQAGLWPFLPFWAQTVKDTVQLPEYYSKVGTPEYPYPVSSHLYASRGMKDSLWHWIINSKIQEKVNRTPYDYKYSDMGFYIMMHLAEKLLNQPMEEFLDQNFYEILGASTTGYLPLLRFPASRIAPTEDDKLFRRSLLIGYVHDQGAAMHGGIAGHAGLFSTPNDLAKLAQMWLQKGTYGGHRFFKPGTVDFFTTKQFENSRRGLGWDKPVVSDPNGPTSAFASPKTFGHTGFTGISVWVDPEFDLVFIFFSNRVYPDMTNNKILNANIRPRIQDVVYRSIFKYCANHN